MHMCAIEQVLCGVCVSVFQRGQYGEMCVAVSTLCKYTLKKGDYFFLI